MRVGPLAERRNRSGRLAFSGAVVAIEKEARKRRPLTQRGKGNDQPPRRGWLRGIGGQGAGANADEKEARQALHAVHANTTAIFDCQQPDRDEDKGNGRPADTERIRWLHRCGFSLSPPPPRQQFDQLLHSSAIACPSNTAGRNRSSSAASTPRI